MFERYTETARRSIFFARYEASQFGSPVIETEHLLLGILRGGTEQFRGKLPSAEQVRKAVEGRSFQGEKISTATDLPLSHTSKQVLAYGAEEAERLSQGHIGPEHLLVGLLRSEDSLAAVVLTEFGLRLDQLRQELSNADIPRRESGHGVNFERLPRPGRGWMMEPGSARTQLLARNEAAQCGAPCIETVHVLLALAYEKDLAGILPAPVETLRDWVKQAAAPARERVDARNLAFSELAQRAFIFASEQAARSGQPTGPRQVMLGLLQEANAATQILEAHGFNAAEVRARLSQPPGRDYV